ncbi:hypothetical protein M0805_006478 [Coniferiporia weirii]|nr:hypothetical protein M0805_006478 [Coniferiporia weirii]
MEDQTTTAITTLHLIYIHGFQGDHTSFQSFPTDLHERLCSRLPAGITLKSCLYPTYKSRRPISEATHKFLEWLSTQPPGPVILLAHSMGGLLAADAATSASVQSKRIIGLVAFDVPFLGMHPHVIVSGITSLFPKDTEEGKNTEKDLNDENIVKFAPGDDTGNSSATSREGVTPPSLHHKRPYNTGSLKATSPATSNTTLSSSSSFSLSGSRLEEDWEAHKATFQCKAFTIFTMLYLTPPTAPQRPRSSQPKSTSSSQSPSSSSSIRSLFSSFANSTKDAFPLKLPALPSPVVGKLGFAADKLAQHANTPFVRWLRKHSDDPLNAMTTWVVEYFEFGICQFDPAGLSERYRALENWSGCWVNFWTQTPARVDKASAREAEGVEDRDVQAGALPSNTADVVKYAEAGGSSTRTQVNARKDAEQELRKERDHERKHGGARPARHFIVLPHRHDALSDALHFGSREKWELVPIEGVEDEVGAHCGLFIRAQNIAYEELVGRVAKKVDGWCQGFGYWAS